MIKFFTLDNLHEVRIQSHTKLVQFLLDLLLYLCQSTIKLSFGMTFNSCVKRFEVNFLTF